MNYKKNFVMVKVVQFKEERILSTMSLAGSTLITTVNNEDWFHGPSVGAVTYKELFKIGGKIIKLEFKIRK